MFYNLALQESATEKITSFLEVAKMDASDEGKELSFAESYYYKYLDEAYGSLLEAGFSEKELKEKAEKLKKDAEDLLNSNMEKERKEEIAFALIGVASLILGNVVVLTLPTLSIILYVITILLNIISYIKRIKIIKKVQTLKTLKTRLETIRLTVKDKKVINDTEKVLLKINDILDKFSGYDTTR